MGRESWMGPKSGPPAKGNGSCAQGESRNPEGRTLGEDTGGKVYKDIERALKPTKDHKLETCLY